MTLLLIRDFPNLGQVWFEPVGSKWIDPEDFDNNGVIYVGY